MLAVFHILPLRGDILGQGVLLGLGFHNKGGDLGERKRRCSVNGIHILFVGGVEPLSFLETRIEEKCQPKELQS
jgi:hypothetical protein